MNSKEFFNKMLEIEKIKDEEICHIKADDLMCELLRELGYEDGIDVFERMYKWYA